jgi:hypothetical protein
MNTNELISIGLDRRYIRDRNATALYASAGYDTKAISFLNPGFLMDRGVDGYNAPEFFIYIDRSYVDQSPIPFSYKDENTIITTDWNIEIDYFDYAGHCIGITYDSKKYGKRRVSILFVAMENKDIFPIMQNERWIPDTFIGVCDGCCFGGNMDGCVNTLEPSPINMPMPKYWVTDHFSILGRGILGTFDTYRANLPNPLPVSEDVISPNRNYRYKFRKVALLSSDWGGYASHHPQLGGATLFRVLPINST